MTRLLILRADYLDLKHFYSVQAEELTKYGSHAAGLIFSNILLQIAAPAAFPASALTADRNPTTMAFVGLV